MSIGKHIRIVENLEGSCDICSREMPPSGGIATAEAMKTLVESGFNPYSDVGPVTEHLIQLFEKEGVPRSKVIERMKMRIVKKEMGDFALCPKCFKKIQEYIGRGRP